MSEKDLLKRITVDSKVLVGKPVIRGLRISVDQILKALANGTSYTAILEDYPDLEMEDIHAVLLYASEMRNLQQVYPISV